MAGLDDGMFGDRCGIFRVSGHSKRAINNLLQLTNHGIRYNWDFHQVIFILKKNPGFWEVCHTLEISSRSSLFYTWTVCKSSGFFTCCTCMIMLHIFFSAQQVCHLNIKCFFQQWMWFVTKKGADIQFINIFSDKSILNLKFCLHYVMTPRHPSIIQQWTTKQFHMTPPMI